MRWIEVAVDATDRSVDAVTNILLEEGCGGTAVGGSSDCVAGARVTGYFPADDRAEARLRTISERVRGLPAFGLDLVSEELAIRWVEDTEWLDAWKQFFRPIRVGRILVTPSWEHPSPEPGDVVVELDPGMAFGTGYHETTRLCLLALQDRITGGETVLDVGTGSGILAIAAARLGASRVVGLDVDRTAVEVAASNVRAAGLDGAVQIREADSPRAFDGEADVVTANIVAETIIDLADALIEKTRPGGTLIVSGIILDREADVSRRLSALNVEPIGQRYEGEWAALEFRRPRTAAPHG